MNLRRMLHRALHETVEFATVSGTWYVLLAGVVWLAFYVLFRRWIRSRKINPKSPTRGQIGWEIRQSILSLAIFGLSSGLVVFLRPLGIKTRLYHPIDLHGLTWYYASIAVAIVIHDAYFYWTHRLMHHPKLFRRVHRIHHLSNNPTPWAAYSFSIPEAIVQAGTGLLIVYLVPMHFSAFLLFMTWQITFNVFGHCGYEIYPRWFLNTWMGKLFNTPTHHAMHHEKVHANYSLYFNYWDRLFGTNHADYSRRFTTAASGTLREAERTREPVAQ